MPAVETKTHSEKLSAAIALTTSFSDGAANFPLANRQGGKLMAVHLFGTGITGAQTITVQLFRDSTLNKLAVPATDITTVPGIGTATEWSALLLTEIGHPGEVTNLYVRAKLGSGTGQIETTSRLVWVE